MMGYVQILDSPDICLEHNAIGLRSFSPVSMELKLRSIKEASNVSEERGNRFRVHLRHLCRQSADLADEHAEHVASAILQAVR